MGAGPARWTCTRCSRSTSFLVRTGGGATNRTGPAPVAPHAIIIMPRQPINLGYLGPGRGRRKIVRAHESSVPYPSVASNRLSLFAARKPRNRTGKACGSVDLRVLPREIRIVIYLRARSFHPGRREQEGKRAPAPRSKDFGSRFWSSPAVASPASFLLQGSPRSGRRRANGHRAAKRGRSQLTVEGTSVPKGTIRFKAFSCIWTEIRGLIRARSERQGPRKDQETAARRGLRVGRKGQGLSASCCWPSSSLCAGGDRRVVSGLLLTPPSTSTSNSDPQGISPIPSRSSTSTVPAFSEVGQWPLAPERGDRAHGRDATGAGGALSDRDGRDLSPEPDGPFRRTRNVFGGLSRPSDALAGPDGRASPPTTRSLRGGPWCNSPAWWWARTRGSAAGRRQVAADTAPHGAR